MRRYVELLGLLCVLFCAAVSHAAFGQYSGDNIYVCPMGHGRPAMYTDQPCPGKSGKTIHKATKSELISQLRKMIVNGDPDAMSYAAAHGLTGYYLKVTQPGADPELDQAILRQNEIKARQAANARAEQERVAQEQTEYQAQLARKKRERLEKRLNAPKVCVAVANGTAAYCFPQPGH